MYLIIICIIILSVHALKFARCPRSRAWRFGASQTWSDVEAYITIEAQVPI